MLKTGVDELLELLDTLLEPVMLSDMLCEHFEADVDTNEDEPILLEGPIDELTDEVLLLPPVVQSPISQMALLILSDGSASSLRSVVFRLTQLRVRDASTSL